MYATGAELGVGVLLTKVPIPFPPFFEVDASASRNSKAGKLPKESGTRDNTESNMPTAIRNTVDRLDKPSAYYQSRVSHFLGWLRRSELGWTDNELAFRTRSANTTGMAMMRDRGHPMSRRKTH